MKAIIYLFPLLIHLNSAHAGTDIFDEIGPSLEGQWEGYLSDFPMEESFTVGVNPRTFTANMSRQVAHPNKPGLPFPTNCVYKLHAQPSLEECSAGDLQPEGACNHEQNRPGTPSKYLLVLKMTSIELTPSEENSPGCTAFVLQQKKEILNGQIQLRPFALNARGEYIQYGVENYRRK